MMMMMMGISTNFADNSRIRRQIF